jgi:predicted esterase
MGGPPRTAWFDLLALPPSEEERNVPPLYAQLQIETTVGDFVQLIEAEVARGVPLNRVFIIGYSNGGAISLLTWLIGLKGAAIGGLGVFAAWLHDFKRAKEAMSSPDTPNKDGGAYTPVLWAHGAEDDIIPLTLALEAGRILREEGLASENTFNLRKYEGEGHEVNYTQLDDMMAWLSTRVNAK